MQLTMYNIHYQLMFLLYSPVTKPEMVQAENGYEKLEAELSTNLTITFTKTLATTKLIIELNCFT